MQSADNRFSLAGKTAIVTGALGFLGRHFCSGLAEAGANVIIADLDPDSCEKYAAELSAEHGIRSAGLQCDVTSPESVRAMTGRAAEGFGCINILVNNAAYRSKNADSICAPFEEYSVDEWKRMMDINVTGVFLCSQAVGSLMIKQKPQGGSIIQISSIYGILGTDHRIYESANRTSGGRMNNPASYSASKGAVIAFTKYLAAYWADKGIRVNALSPGGVQNNQPAEFIGAYSSRVPMRRMGRPDELVGALLFLSSDASSYVTGQNVVVDGGLSAW